MLSLMFEHGTKGGITQAVHQYPEANNKYMGDKFNSKEDNSYPQYLGANNLCDWVMIQPLPTRGFNWVEPSEFTPDKIDSYANWDSEGYLLEVDVRYSKELHDLHNDLLLICEKMKINRVEKLVPNLNDKNNYIVHIKALNEALKHGLILEKVHRVIEFNFYDYKNCLLNVKSKSIFRPQLMFRNNKHEIHTIEVNKVALNRDDDKWIVKKDE